MNPAKSLARAEIDPVWLLRIFTAIPVVLILLAGTGALWMYFFVLSLLPDGQSLVETAGLSSEVKVIRDAHGVPGIIGEREEDVAMVLGYVMAQDRLWQMDYLRRAGEGRLAEIMGSDHLEGDHLMRSARAGTSPEQELSALGERERRWLTRFVRGINKYIAVHEGKFPVEFSLLEYRPRPFAPEDIQSILYAVAWESSPAMRIDPLMAAVLGRLGPERSKELFPHDSATPDVFVASELTGWAPKGPLFGLATAGRSVGRVPALLGGSGWAVGKERTRSGKPMIAASVYQQLSAPGFWYRARLAAGDLQLTGSFIPGVPLAFSGTNEAMSWACFPAPADDADLYIEQLDSDEAETSWRDTRSRRVEAIRERYRVRGGSSVTRTIRVTETGPLVSEVHKGLALSLRWTAREGLGVISCFFALNRARERNELATALRSLKAPVLTCVWADEKGNYGMRTAGRVPVRPPGSDGIVPMPSWTGVHEWRGYIPFDELPAQTNPPQGFLVSSDGRFGGSSYPFFVSCYGTDEGRTRRISELLRGTNEHHRQTFQTIQADALSPLAQELVPLLVTSLRAVPRNNATEDQALRLLGTWDFTAHSGSSGASVFGLVYKSLVNELLPRPLGEELADEYAAEPILTAPLARAFLTKQGNAGAADAGTSRILAQAFSRAIASGRSLMGDDPGKWRWGRVHTATFRHPLAVRSRFLETLYDVGPLSCAGSFDAIASSGGSPSRPFAAVTGVTLRHIADMTAPPQLYGVTPLGISGHFFSTHYRDPIRTWLDGKAFAEPLQASDIRKSGFSTVLFRPVTSGTALLN